MCKSCEIPRLLINLPYDISWIFQKVGMILKQLVAILMITREGLLWQDFIDKRQSFLVLFLLIFLLNIAQDHLIYLIVWHDIWIGLIFCLRLILNILWIIFFTVIYTINHRLLYVLIRLCLGPFFAKFRENLLLIVYDLQIRRLVFFFIRFQVNDWIIRYVITYNIFERKYFDRLIIWLEVLIKLLPFNLVLNLILFFSFFVALMLVKNLVFEWKVMKDVCWSGKLSALALSPQIRIFNFPRVTTLDLFLLLTNRLSIIFLKDLFDCSFLIFMQKPWLPRMRPVYKTFFLFFDGLLDKRWIDDLVELSLLLA